MVVTSKGGFVCPMKCENLPSSLRPFSTNSALNCNFPLVPNFANPPSLPQSTASSHFSYFPARPQPLTNPTQSSQKSTITNAGGSLRPTKLAQLLASPLPRKKPTQTQTTGGTKGKGLIDDEITLVYHSHYNLKSRWMIYPN